MQILSQQKDSKKKIYSIHEPELVCISKGKEHKKYEFDSKVSFAKIDSGVITAAAFNLKRMMNKYKIYFCQIF